VEDIWNISCNKLQIGSVRGEDFLFFVHQKKKERNMEDVVDSFHTKRENTVKDIAYIICIN